MPLPRLPTSTLSTPEPGGAVFYSGIGEAPEARERALRIREAQRRQREIEAERAKHRPQMERLSDDEARELLRSGEHELSEIHSLLNKVQDRVEAQREKVHADEVAIATTQSVYRSSLEVFIANPLARRPDDISGTIAELRAKYDIHHAQLLTMESDLSAMAGTYQTAANAARRMLDRAYHHLSLNTADRFADRYEAAMRDAVLADAALRGLIDRAILEKDTIAQTYTNRCLEGVRIRTPDEMMRYRASLNKEAGAVRERYHDRNAVHGES
jgi:hypothetical protein